MARRVARGVRQGGHMELKEEHFDDSLQDYAERDPELHRELRDKVSRRLRAEGAEGVLRSIDMSAQLVAPTAPGVAPDPRRFVETIVRPNARPVLIIRDNQITTDF